MTVLCLYLILEYLLLHLIAGIVQTFAGKEANCTIPRRCVVDPNALNLDPDPGFWPNLDQDPIQARIRIQCYAINFERNFLKQF